MRTLGATIPRPAGFVQKNNSRYVRLKPSRRRTPPPPRRQEAPRRRGVPESPSPASGMPPWRVEGDAHLSRRFLVGLAEGRDVRKLAACRDESFVLAAPVNGYGVSLLHLRPRSSVGGTDEPDDLPHLIRLRLSLVRLQRDDVAQRVVRAMRRVIPDVVGPLAAGLLASRLLDEATMSPNGRFPFRRRTSSQASRKPYCSSRLSIRPR